MTDDTSPEGAATESAPADPTPPGWFKVVAVVAILWNLIGVAQFFAQVMMSAEAVAELPEAQRQMLEAMPGWVMVAFAVGVFAGTAGSVLLWLRKSLALPVLILSFVGAGSQFLYNVLVAGAPEVLGPPFVILAGLIIGVGAGLIGLAWHAGRRGWLS